MHTILRRTLVYLVLLAATSPFARADKAAARGGGPWVLENNAIHVEIEQERGGLLRLGDKIKGIDLVSPPELSEGFRLLVPLPEAPQNFILGKDQRASASEVARDRLGVFWNGPLKDQAGRAHDMAAGLTAELAGKGLVFRFRLENRSKHVVQEVWYLGLGGLLGFGPADKAGATLVHAPPHERPLRSPFGQHVVTYPGQNMPFVSFDNAAVGRGLYFGVHDPVARFKAIHLGEITAGERRNVAANVVHFPFVRPGQTFEAAPVVVQFHDGDWIAAGRSIYRPWFEKTFGLIGPEQDWIRRQSFFQFVMIMLPEGNVNYTIKQIPQLARDGLKYGVKSLHISGWQRGGHDNGYPYYEPDPRLGTWDDIEEAMRQCHALGVQVYFFVNIHVNTLDTEWYQKELKDYDYENRQGQRYSEVGWGMGTLAARIGHTTPLMTFGDVTFPGLRDRLSEYFKRLAQAGVDGIHIDKCYPGPLNFNPRIAMSPDQSPWEGTVRLIDAIRRECRAIRPDFCISIETTWDRSLAFGASTWWGGNMTAARRVFPELAETVGLYQPFDYAGVNDAVRNGYAVMVAPYHFNRSMDHEAWRGLSEYIRETKRIRDELAESVFFGEYLGPSEVRLAQPKSARPFDYATFRNRRDGKLACVLTHRGAAAESITLTGLGHRDKGPVRIYRPFEPVETAQLPAKVVVPSERFAIVTEPELAFAADASRVACRHAAQPRVGMLEGEHAHPPLGGVRACHPNLVLEDAAYRVEVDPDHGTIARILDKAGHLELLQEPRLADNFRFTLPLRGPTAWESTEANYILGKDQRLSSHEISRDKMTLRWNAPLTSVLGKPYDVSATMQIQRSGAGLRFEFRIDNRTPLEIGEVFAPILGGSVGLGQSAQERRETELLLPAGTGLRRERVFRTFANMSWLGIFGPEQYYSYPDGLSMPWVDLHQPARKRGFYFGAHDGVARYKLIHLEMSPGISGPRAEGNWPRPDESRGLPVGVKIALVHIPYQPGGRPFEASPVVLAAHDGGWEAGAKIYGAWFASQFDRDAARRSWMQTSAAAETCPRVPFRDLPARARVAASCGVGELLLTDWKAGGHADGAPRFEPDPSLGSRQDMADAIGRSSAMGVKVTVTVNVQPVSRTQEWYRSELHRFACQDRWGIVATQLGWGTGATLTDGFASGQRRAWLGVGAPEMRRLLSGQIRELARLGVDGVYLQDFFGRTLDFNPATGKTADRATWEGGLECVREMVAAGSRLRPGFSVSAATPWDRLMTIAPTPAIEAPAESSWRIALPFCRPLHVVSDSDDFGSINRAILEGGKLRVAPANQQPMGGAEMADLAAYLKAVLGAKEALRHTLVEGEALADAAMKIEGRVQCAVFRNPQSALRSAVLVNEHADAEEVTCKGFADSGGRPLTVWQPALGPRKCVAPVRLTIPGEQLAIVTEQPATDRLAGVARWTTSLATRRQRVLVEFRSPGDLRGWTLEGEAFSVCAMPGLFRKCTLNSLATAGEAATGLATSPRVTIAPEFDAMEIVFHGGRSAPTGRGLNLALRVIDAESGRMLLELSPPGTHVLTTQTIPLGPLRGKTVRFQLVDENTAGSYAWIGLRRVSLVTLPH